MLCLEYEAYKLSNMTAMEPVGKWNLDTRGQSKFMPNLNASDVLTFRQHSQND
jgi:hypothetical protein